MAVMLEKAFQTDESIEKVWMFLSDTRKVASCLPGVQITEQLDDQTYRGSISVKVGPSVTDYKGEVHIVRMDALNREMEILGKGQDVRGRGSASMKMTGKLRALPDGGGTEVLSVSELNVVGILAQMGSRVINEVSNIMFDQFTRNFQEKLRQQEAVPAAVSNGAPAVAPVARPISGLALMWKAFWSSLAGLFRRKP